METVFTSDLGGFLKAVAGEMELYVPKKSGEHYIFTRYDGSKATPVELNNIRACTPAKEFLFPLCELVATYPKTIESAEIKPFAVFGLKECDIKSMAILDKVFAEEDFMDPFYMARREAMFIVSSDCFDPGESCFCNLFDGKGSADSGFDLNVSKVKGGFIIEAGSQKGEDFVGKHSAIFGDVTDAMLAERNQSRAKTSEQLKEQNAEFEVGGSLRDVVENNQDSVVFDTQAKKCIECQACTRVCPTCHCFFLYDVKKKDYFAKMKMWDGCMRFGYNAVAGGENPNKILGDRMKHRLLHKFVYFLDRYGIDMCVGCGRCVDADAGGMDLREILKKLSQETKVS